MALAMVTTVSCTTTWQVGMLLQSSIDGCMDEPEAGERARIEARMHAHHCQACNDQAIGQAAGQPQPASVRGSRQQEGWLEIKHMSSISLCENVS